APGVAAVEEPYEPLAPEVAAVEEPYEPLAPEVTAVVEPYEPLAPEVAAVEEPDEPPAPEVAAVVEPYGPLAPEVAAVEEPYEPLAPEVAAVEEPYEPLAAEAEAPEELDEPLAAEVPAVEEPAEVAAEDVAAVEEIAELAIGAQAAAAAEEPDWVIDRALDEDPAGEGAAAGEPASGQPLAAETSAEPSTDIEAVLADILEAEDAWDGPAEGADGAELGRLEELLAAPAAPAQESGAAEDEAVPAGLDEETALEVLGPYELLEMLEFGDLTERWRAVRSGDDGTEVVVERIRHELRSRADVRQAFVDGCSEAAGWAQENILPVVDLGRDGDVDYVATEYHRGHSLREVLERVRRMEARMPLGIGLLIAERVGAGLQTIAAGPAASRHGWLVPGSIWLTLDGEVLLREFGFGRLAAVADVAPLDWTEYRFLGPEVWSRQADSRSDLYSLGALLYEMIGGRKTHAADDLESLVATIRSTDIARAQTVDPTIPSEVDGWIMRLLRRSPSERPQAVAEIASKVDLALQSLPARPSNAELAAYLRQLFAARVPEQPAEAARPPAAVAAPVADADEVRPPAWRLGARRWRWWLAAALLALLVALLVWRWAAGRESSDTASRSADSAARLEGQPDAASRAQG
ncbi:MAG: protein kinase, partial [Acidobacteriota bacterium]|nr:protein kinase [Acidobacteriota bacterium]